jgi:hypothetical protein
LAPSTVAPVIKRLRFADRLESTSTSRDAPHDVRPLHLTVATALPEHNGSDPKHLVFTAEWFNDAAHLDRFDQCGGADAGLSIVVEEQVLRGADWLERRWRESGPRHKHVAFAQRSLDLTPAEFSRRWRTHAGQSGGAVIPEEARGQAYVQNHPVLRSGGEWVYDAVTEVWFDDHAGLQARIDWFTENPPGDTSLFRQFWFLATLEHCDTDSG